MMNNNDYHYIMRRIITFMIISALSFFFFTSCAKAEVSTAYWKDNASYSAQNNYYVFTPTSRTLTNKGEGQVLFTFASNTAFKEVQFFNSQNGATECNIGSVQSYTDAYNTQMVVYTALCPTTLGSNGINRVVFTYAQTPVNNLYINISDFVTFTNWDSPGTDYTALLTDIITNQGYLITGEGNIRNDISTFNNNMISSINSLLTAVNSNNTNITNAISSQSQQQHQDAQDTQDAIDDNTQAINDLNDSINADYQSDTSWYGDFEGITGNNSNYIRSLLLWPTTFLGNIANASANHVCSQLDLGTLWGVHIYLPCINWKNYVGNAIYISIDTIMGMCVLFGLITYVRRVFDYMCKIGVSGYELVSVEVFK